MLCETFSRWRNFDFGPQWREVMTWLETHGPSAEEGRYEMGECFINVAETETKRLDSCLFESHRRMVDVQVVFDGAEWLYTASIANLPLLDPFDENKDMGYHIVPSVEMTRVSLTPGVFALLFPWDAHMPLVAIDNNPKYVRKAVAKIPLDLLKL